MDGHGLDVLGGNARPRTACHSNSVYGNMREDGNSNGDDIGGNDNDGNDHAGV